MTRLDGRAPDELRPITFERDYTEMAAGVVLVSFGKTRVLCTASIDENVPRWMKGTGKGWVTAEYSMLPGASPERIDREAAKGKQSGRTVEIQRLIGRRCAPRATCDCSASGRWSSTATCCRPTAAHAPPASAAATSRCTMRSTRLVQNNVDQDPSTALVLRGDQRRHRRRRADARPPVRRGQSIAEVDMNVVMLGNADARAAVRRGAGHCRGRGVLARRARPAAGAGRRRACRRSWRCKPRWSRYRHQPRPLGR